MIIGELCQILDKVSFKLWQTKVYPWSLNVAEMNIKELKKSLGRKLINSKAPKHWNSWLGFDSYIVSTLVMVFISWVGKYLWMMSGKTSDNSQFYKCEWFIWMMQRDKTTHFLGTALELDWYLSLIMILELIARCCTNQFIVLSLRRNGRSRVRKSYSSMYEINAS